MENFKYTISIRTVGKGGSKYQSLLDSIDKLNIRPDEVHIILPNGYEPPSEKLGYEEFLYCEKGMMKQRIAGAKFAKNDYILFLDDDVSFESDLIEHLAKPLVEGKCDITIPPQVNMLPKKKGIQKYIAMIKLNMIPRFCDKYVYNTLILSGGCTYNRIVPEQVNDYMYAETGPGIGFMITKKAFFDSHYEEELWVEESGYAWPDDQVMFYKSKVCGYKMLCATQAKFLHLDGGVWTKTKSEQLAYAWGRNFLIFWKKFIYNRQRSCFKKILSYLMYKWSEITNNLFWLFEDKVRKKKTGEYRLRIKGIKDAKIFLKEHNL